MAVAGRGRGSGQRYAELAARYDEMHMPAEAAWARARLSSRAALSTPSAASAEAGLCEPAPGQRLRLPAARGPKAE